jgi:hypothetical protein
MERNQASPFRFTAAARALSSTNVTVGTTAPLPSPSLLPFRKKAFQEEGLSVAHTGGGGVIIIIIIA